MGKGLETTNYVIGDRFSENCIAYVNEAGNGRWSDVPCSFKNSFYCQTWAGRYMFQVCFKLHYTYIQINTETYNYTCICMNQHYWPDSELCAKLDIHTHTIQFKTKVKSVIKVALSVCSLPPARFKYVGLHSLNTSWNNLVVGNELVQLSLKYKCGSSL